MRTLLKALFITGVLLWFVGTSLGTEFPGYSVQLTYPHSGSYQIGTYKLINRNYSVPPGQNQLLNPLDLNIPLLKGGQCVGTIIIDPMGFPCFKV